MLFRLEIGMTFGRCGTVGTLVSPFFSPFLVIAPRLSEDPFRVTVEGGVELPFEWL